MKRFFLIFFTLLAVITVKAQTFVVSEVTPYRDKDRTEAQKMIGSDIKLTFTDNDVSATAKDSDGVSKTIILKSMGNNVYRRKTSNSDDWDSYDEIQLDTFLGYIRGFTFTHIHHKTFGGSFKAKRK